MKPQDLKTKIFLDGGDPKETKAIMGKLGFLDGQTTNPTLISKNPEAQKRLADGKPFTEQEIWRFYKDVVSEISSIIPEGSVSIEVYADDTTSSETMIKQAHELFTWIPNAQIKFPINEAGLTAAEDAIKNSMRVNMTLCFTQQQAAAVYAATKGAKKGDVFLSPFVGRLDDIGIDGMSLVSDCVKLYEPGDGHVEVLSASVRSYEHFMASLAAKADIITSPAKILEEWVEKGLPIPDENYMYDAGDLKAIPLETTDLNKSWNEYDLKHDLTNKGIERFASDWNALIK